MTLKIDRLRAAFWVWGGGIDEDCPWIQTGVAEPCQDVPAHEKALAEQFAAHRAATLREVLALFDAKGANLPTRDDVAALLEEP